ncbi:MAG: extracellular solute-binding protein [Lachnospiraceae bacterium]|jgi:multiple sugar transport system substrate-binding protein|nr:extracellular solute-binding protein [Lachnospiraceae bacterium]
MKKSLSVLAAAVVMAVTLGACSGSATTATTTATTAAPAPQGAAPAATTAAPAPATVAPAPAQAVVEIRFAWWGNEVRNAKYEAMCDAFEAENPDVKVIREPANFDEFLNKMNTQLAGGNGVDVMGVHYNWAADYETRGVLADFQPWIDNGTFDTADITPSVLDAGRINGTLVMAPQGVALDCLYVNQTMVDKLGVYDAFGVDYLGGEQFTWESFANAHRIYREAALAAGEDTWFSALPPENIEAFRYWVRINEPGADVYSADGKLGVSAETIEKWFQWHLDLRENDYMPPFDMTVEQRGQAQEENPFATHKVAGFNTSANQYKSYATLMPEDDIILINFPKAADGYKISSITTSGVGVNAKISPEKLEASFRFVNYFINNVKSYENLQLEQGVPINNKTAAALEAILDEQSRKTLDFTNRTIANVNPQPFVIPPAGGSEFSVAFRDAADRVMYGQQSPAESVAQLLKEAEGIFARQ